jgi:hypothetical protein
LNSLKEGKIGASSKAITTLFICASLIVGFMSVLSMPQMIGPVYALCERASERASPVEGYTLERGECTADPITNLECNPSSLYGVTVVRTGTTCTVQGRVSNIEEQQNQCEEIQGGLFEAVLGKKPPTVICTFQATETIACPGGIIPTEEGECITRPGQGNNPIQ